MYLINIYLAASYTHHSLKTLRPTDVPSKIIVKLGRIRNGRKRIIIINLQQKKRSIQGYDTAVR